MAQPFSSSSDTLQYLPALRLEWASYPRYFGISYLVIKGDILAFGAWLESLGFRSDCTIPNPKYHEHYWRQGAYYTLWRNNRISAIDTWHNSYGSPKIDPFALLAPLVVEIDPQAFHSEEHAHRLIAARGVCS